MLQKMYNDLECLQLAIINPGDFDCNGDVNGKDLSIFAQRFGR
jgi:hypothetical protein